MGECNTYKQFLNVWLVYNSVLIFSVVIFQSFRFIMLQLGSDMSTLLWLTIKYSVSFWTILSSVSPSVTCFITWSLIWNFQKLWSFKILQCFTSKYLPRWVIFLFLVVESIVIQPSLIPSSFIILTSENMEK